MVTTYHRSDGHFDYVLDGEPLEPFLKHWAPVEAVFPVTLIYPWEREGIRAKTCNRTTFACGCTVHEAISPGRIPREVEERVIDWDRAAMYSPGYDIHRAPEF